MNFVTQTLSSVLGFVGALFVYTTAYLVALFVYEGIKQWFWPTVVSDDEYDDDHLEAEEDEAVIINVKKLHPEARLPSYAKLGDAGADLVSVEDVTLMPGEFRLIRTGLGIELPEGWEAQVRSRSGLALKHGIHVLNSPGTIDSGYRGEIGAVLMNHGPMFHIAKGERIAQLVIKPAPQAKFVVAQTLSESNRGTGGFGHTGMKSS